MRTFLRTLAALIAAFILVGIAVYIKAGYMDFIWRSSSMVGWIVAGVLAAGGVVGAYHAGKFFWSVTFRG